MKVGYIFFYFDNRLNCFIMANFMLFPSPSYCCRRRCCSRNSARYRNLRCQSRQFCSKRSQSTAVRYRNRNRCLGDIVLLCVKCVEIINISSPERRGAAVSGELHTVLVLDWLAG